MAGPHVHKGEHGFILIELIILVEKTDSKQVNWFKFKIR